MQTIPRSFYILYICILTCSIFLSLFIPQATHAAKQCPAGLRMEGAALRETIYCMKGSEVVGHAVDPNDYPACTNGIPMYDGKGVTGGVNCVDRDGKPIPGPSGSSATAPKGVDQASCFWYFEFGRCIWIPLMGWAGAFSLSFGAYVLEWAGYLFNMLVKYIVVEFGKTIQELGLLNGIHDGWKILRDISNILIIGMFTFIAISMILGSETFGAKKMVARVLIIAVLINFSLLFTKIIIDAGNFTAYQFYRGMGSDTNDSGANVANKFLAIIGITGAFDTEILTKTGASGQQAQQAGQQAGSNSWMIGVKGFLFGALAGTLLLMAAGVILYGCYLIAARAVLLVFLMIVSALAFATYLIPKISESSYGWKAWWRSLINASVFAPLLMALLYVSLLILTPAARQQTGTFGDMFADPATISQNWKTLIIFIFGIGMLYVSFRVANSFSNQIAGFSTAGAFALTPLALGSRLTGLLARGTVGNLAYRGFRAGRRLGWMDPDDPNSTMLRRGLGSGMRWLGTRTYDPLNQKAVQSFMAKTGAPTFGKDVGKGGYLGVKKEQARRAVEKANDLAPTQDEIRARADAADKRKTERERVADEKKLAELEKLLPAAEKKAKDTIAAYAEKTGQEKDKQAIPQVAPPAPPKNLRDEAGEKEMKAPPPITPKIEVTGLQPTAEQKLNAQIENNMSIAREKDRTSRAVTTAREQALQGTLARLEDEHKLDDVLTQHPDIQKYVGMKKEIEKLTENIKNLSDTEKARARVDKTVSKRSEVVARLAGKLARGGLGTFTQYDPVREFIPGQISAKQRREDLKIYAEEAKKIDNGSTPTPSRAAEPPKQQPPAPEKH